MNEEPTSIQCGEHGDAAPTYVCGHLCRHPVQRWFCDAPSPDTPYPDAWCASCNAELRARKVDHDRAGGTLELGLSLGRFASKEAAERERTNLGTKGVRTARVVQERAEAPGFTLRLPAVNDALRAQLDVLRTAMAGKTLRACG